MNIFFALVAVFALLVIAFFGVEVAGLHALFGIWVPYAALAIFIVGVISRVWNWSRTPVPFRIPTTGGQQKSLPWLKRSRLDNPFTGIEVLARMALEVLAFRSLFRNTRTSLKEDGTKIVYGGSPWLWVGALAFHYSFLLILLRHLRFFMEPLPFPLLFISDLDAILQVGVPVLYLTDVVIVGALTYLFLRRVLDPKVRYISLPADYFALFMILGIAISGILMRYFTKVDIVGVKEMTMGLASFNPVVTEGIGLIFYIHLLFVSVLVAYFPFSKLMHMGGIFFSPTRNMANNSRAQRHINPWDYPVKLHTYEEWEEEFKRGL